MNIIYGAGAAGVIILNHLRSRGEEVEFFIDDNPLLIGGCLQGLKIFSYHQVKNQFDSSYNVYCSFSPSIGNTALINIKNRKSKVFLREHIDEWDSGFIQPKNIIEIDEEFLIGKNAILNYGYKGFELLKSKIILVTGAAGSIGSEIVRSLLNLDVQEIIAIDIDESRLYDLSESLNSCKLKCLLCDISNNNEIEKLFNDFDIHHVFHAAAYKHVPMTDIYPHKPLVNNIIGSLNLLRNSVESKVESILLISTDKAVRPTNLMGASKRIVEKLYSSYECGSSQMRIVRFGNVLKSRGSAIPKFINQVMQGKDISLTDPEMTRYFMTIEEAAYLSIKSAVMPNDGFNTFVLNMGTAHRVIDIIEKIKIFYNAQDIPIKIVGKRPGEKLYEELHSNESEIDKRYPDIFRMKTPRYEGFDIGVIQNRFGEHIYSFNNEQIKNVVSETLGDEYRP